MPFRDQQHARGGAVFLDAFVRGYRMLQAAAQVVELGARVLQRGDVAAQRLDVVAAGNVPPERL